MPQTWVPFGGESGCAMILAFSRSNSSSLNASVTLERLTPTRKPDARIEAAILRSSPDYTREIVEIGGQGGRYVYSRVDLNNDGREEVFVYLLGSIFCGTGGCSMMLLTEAEGGYSLINNFPISRSPVIVSAGKTNGWSNLIRLESGGGARASYVRHTFNGREYTEQERMPADIAPKGTRCLAGEFNFDDGVPLKPRN